MERHDKTDPIFITATQQMLTLHSLLTFGLLKTKKNMRVVGEIPHEVCRITLFAWNNRYLIKLEQGLLEQTYKVNQFDIISEADLYKIVDDGFINDALNRFKEMDMSLQSALERL